MTDRLRNLAAEALGTGILVATVVGSGIMAQRLTDDIALALLGNTIATGAILVVLIGVLGPISGAHFNPAVTLVMALRRQLSAADAGLYVVAQICGAMLGTLLAHLMFDLPLVSAYADPRNGASQWLSEAVATFGLVLTILVSLRYAPEQIAMRVGLYITAAYWFTASTSYANPAVTIGRALTASFAGIGPADVPGFIIAQILGALLAMALSAWLLRPQTERSA
ncbi:glycerol uptake facilitator-like aquaporin [Devosia subaequoris]|uniref:Glycerol uptake facilitator-like aquaporin n=1 Tax=Devosia subaequoris TaxID=395930 RepID=A0A7W6ING1_9HYPH|nr:MIP/aquaporin family protein [Devosia subaequoris]MBB4052808.1 glycerol uptake facilitator-like aquaporin [Devosia subaequoris]MCP1209959.1 aquaporin family protein [Devosia subaequoris]